MVDHEMYQSMHDFCEKVYGLGESVAELVTKVFKRTQNSWSMT